MDCYSCVYRWTWKGEAGVRVWTARCELKCKRLMVCTLFLILHFLPLMTSSCPSCSGVISPTRTLFSFVCIYLCFLIYIKNQFYSLYQEIRRSIVVIYFVVICNFILDFNLSRYISKLYSFTCISIHFTLMYFFSHFCDCFTYIFLIPVLYYFITICLYWYFLCLIWLNFLCLAIFSFKFLL